jgi:uncharacterized paraquat-inducible protein A
MSLDSDIRDLNRSVKTLIKATEALNNTLVAIERARVEEKTEYCRECNAAVCIPDTEGTNANCPCCKVHHNRDAFRKYAQGLSNR